MKKLAELGEEYIDESTLADIYERTYKYGWLDAKEREEGWLPDRPYMAKARIKGELSPLLEVGLDALEECYKDWIEFHTRDGWTQEMMNFNENFGLEGVINQMNTWAASPGSDIDDLTIRDEVHSFIENEVVGDEGQREWVIHEDFWTLVDLFGEQFIENNIEEMSLEMQEFWEENQDVHEFFDKFNNPNYVLEDPLIDWVVENTDYGTFSDLVSNLGEEEAFNFLNLTSNDIYTLIHDRLYDLYLNCFPGLEEEIDNIQEMYDTLQYRYANDDIGNQIVMFQLGLTTAHHYGTMADHLLGVGAGEGKVILDGLSNRNTEEWDRELRSYLGYQPDKQEEQMRTYYEPELGRHLSKIAQEDFLIDEFRESLNKLLSAISHTEQEEEIVGLAREIEEKIDFIANPKVYEGPHERSMVPEAEIEAVYNMIGDIAEIALTLPDEELTSDLANAIEGLYEFIEPLKAEIEEYNFERGFEDALIF